MNDESISNRVGYIAFLECVFNKKSWRVMPHQPGGPITYVATSGNSIVSIVRPDGLRRSWNIKKGEKVSLFTTVLAMNLDSVGDEITVDEDQQFGKSSSSNTVF